MLGAGYPHTTHFYNDDRTRAVIQQALEDATPEMISKMQEAVGRPQPTCNLEGEDGGLHLVIHNTINDERFKIALEWGCTLGNAAIALWGGLAEFRSTDTFGVRSKGVQIDVAAKVDDLVSIPPPMAPVALLTIS